MSRPRKKVKLVYGEVNDGLVFIPENQAFELAVTHRAVQTARTWGELRRLMPEMAYDDILGWMRDEAVTFDEFLEQQRGKGVVMTPSEAEEEFSDVSIGDRFPKDDDAFEPSQLWGYLDGDWPEFPSKRMMDWVPQAIQDEFGEIVNTMLNGEQLHFDVELEKKIVSALRKCGFTCVKNADIVWWACGGDSASI